MFQGLSRQWASASGVARLVFVVIVIKSWSNLVVLWFINLSIYFQQFIIYIAISPLICQLDIALNLFGRRWKICTRKCDNSCLTFSQVSRAGLEGPGSWISLWKRQKRESPLSFFVNYHNTLLEELNSRGHSVRIPTVGLLWKSESLNWTTMYTRKPCDLVSCLFRTW